MGAILKREFRSYFTTPLGYVFIALFLAANGLVFGFSTLKQGMESDILFYFNYLIMGYILIIPILTMKMFSEEKKTRTEQLLLTAPVSLWKMVIAKFLAAYVLFLIALAAGMLNFFVLYMYGTPNIAVVIGSLIGVALIGGACIGIGMFISALTENQLVSAIAAMGVLLAIIMAGFFNGNISIAPIRTVLSWISLLNRFTLFGYGIFDFTSLLYYISIAWLFIFLTVRIYERRRWS